MNEQPLISIITVTYNAEKVIDKTMNSLKDQTFKGFEHLIIDGSSTDSTIEIIKNARLSQTQILSEPDKGLYDAMNKGLKRAKGKYVIFLNAGDAFHSSKSLESYAREASKDKDIIYGDTVISNLEGNIIGKRHLSVPECLTANSFSDGMLICHQAFMVKKDLAPLYDLSYHFSADYDWCVKCINKTVPENCVNLQEVSIDYLSQGLTDKNKWKSLKERFLIMKKHYGFLPTTFKHISFIFRALLRGKI